MADEESAAPEEHLDAAADEQGDPAAEQHAVPTGDAEEIASVAEDAALEAYEEAHEASDTVEETTAVAPEAEAPDAIEVEAPDEIEAATADAFEDEPEESAPRVKPAVPGAHLEVDIVPEGADPLGRSDEYEDPYAIDDDDAEDREQDEGDAEDEELSAPIATAAIDLASGARYRATGKRKTAIARVTLRPGTGTYLINGRSLEDHFPRATLQRNIRQPLETVGYQDRMDVVARLHGGGISSQAGALRHGVSKALLEADPNLRGELKRRGFLTRDSRVKERKKAGLKKARKRPQFSKR
jgi:small subunit ribosomal protein S9